MLLAVVVVHVLDYRTTFALMAATTALGGVHLLARLGRSAFIPDAALGPAVAES